MSEKKWKSKEKDEPKDQRKRHGRRQKVDDDIDKKNKGQTQPLKEMKSEPPPPEFFQNLKRETDEILKITEEVNSKYKNKEIKSNWAKYEMHIESYDEIEERENLGADYETLALAPISLGGHFKFKYEKSWDTEAHPSIYDKHFDGFINTKTFKEALLTIPFYERNSIDVSIFTESDIQKMNNRTSMFKQNYKIHEPPPPPDFSDSKKQIILDIKNTSQQADKEIRNTEEIKNKSKKSSCDISDENLSIIIREEENIVIPKEELISDIKLEENERIEPSKLNATVINDDSGFNSVLEDLINKETTVINDHSGFNIVLEDLIKKDADLSKEIEITLDNTVNHEDNDKKTGIETSDKVDLEKWLDEFLDTN
ncbi:unnamed protein product [Leptidea sinapis]|uniref:Uncharacterized protein n=1 Tax=Leptidea sinapis TaxID=189913 RepID=A0A5E4Q8M9_9NEOP|nr:unnamed protein product [Leptidea sinapis]